MSKLAIIHDTPLARALGLAAEHTTNPRVRRWLQRLASSDAEEAGEEIDTAEGAEEEALRKRRREMEER